MSDFDWTAENIDYTNIPLGHLIKILAQIRDILSGIHKEMETTRKLAESNVIRLEQSRQNPPIPHVLNDLINTLSEKMAKSHGPLAHRKSD